MNKLVLKSFLSVVALTAVFSCNKEEEEAPKQTKTQLISAGEWVRSNLEGLNPPYDTLDLWSSFDPCLKDDVYKLESNGNGTVALGTPCEPGDPATRSFTWEWKNNETELHIYEQDTTVFTEVTISSTTLTGVKDEIFGPARHHFTRK